MRKGRLAEAGLLLGATVLCLGAAEAGLRLLRPSIRQPFQFEHAAESERGKFCVYDPALGWTGKPEASGVFRYFDCAHGVRQNRYGFRGAAYDFRRSGKERIVALGDSFTWGFGVEDAEIFTSLLEKESRAPLEVVNLGVSGYGTDQELLLWRGLGKRFKPDVVLLAVVPYTDIWENTVNSAYRRAKPSFRLDPGGALRLTGSPAPRPGPDAAEGLVSWPTHWLGRLAARSALVGGFLVAASRAPAVRRWLGEREIMPLRDRAHESIPPGLFLEPMPRPDSHWALLLALIGEVDREVRASGARLRVLVVPSIVEVYPDLWREYAAAHPPPPGLHLDPDKPDRVIFAYCKSRGIAVTSPLARLRAEARRDPYLYYGWNGHWTASGHRLVAARLLEDLGR